MKELIVITILLLAGNLLYAIPKYDEGAILINGVQLLQHKDFEDQYYYIPQYPHLSKNQDGDFELLCIKYLGNNNVSNGGLFHALIEFTLPDEILAVVQKELQKQKPGATIIGPVKLLEPTRQLDDEKKPSFQIVSAILNDNKGDNSFTTSVITSGYAPFTPGSKAAVAAILSQEGATLMWDSFTGATSDVSVTVNGFYEAYVKGYNVTVTANMDIIYKHFSEITNNQEGYQKSQIRNITDSLIRDGSINVEKFDRSATMNIDASDLENILNIVTNKLVEVMFDAETGWSQIPEKVDATLGFDERGRRGDKSEASEAIGAVGDALYNLTPAGWFNPKKNDKNPGYITDNQYILKDITDVRTSKFYMNLTASSTIKVPLHASGNLGGVYDQFAGNKNHFRIVDMNDADFQKRIVNFHLDGSNIPGFNDLINYVSINFKKEYPSSTNQNDVTSSVTLTSDKVTAGETFVSCTYPRFGLDADQFVGYQYQVSWSLKGSNKVIRYPESETEWLETKTSDVLLSLPFEQTELIIDADREMFREMNIKSASVAFATSRAGEPQIIRNLILRDSDVSNTNNVFLYRDPDQPIVYQITWYMAGETKETELIQLKGNYLFLTPPKE